MRRKFLLDEGMSRSTIERVPGSPQGTSALSNHPPRSPASGPDPLPQATDIMSDPQVQTITKKVLVNRISERTGQTKVVVKEILQLLLDEVVDELAQGNRLEFREFGVFEVRQRASRQAQNPRTLEKVEVPSRRVVKFKVGRKMRERVGSGDPPPPAPIQQEEPVVTIVPTPVTPPPPPPPAPETNSPF